MDLKRVSKKGLEKVHYLVSLNEWAGEGITSERGTVNGRGYRTLDTVVIVPTAGNLRATISVGGYDSINNREISTGADGGGYTS